MAIHNLKFKGRDLCDAVYAGRKTHEIRYNDRNYTEGDIIHPIALADDLAPIEHPINRVTYKVGYVSVGAGIEDGYCVFSLHVVEDLNLQSVVRDLITQEVE